MEHLLKARKSSHIDQPVQRIIIGVAGGSAAGKTTLCQNINRQMAFDRNFKVEMVSLDSFYKTLDTSIVNPKDYNFDHPSALDFDLAYETLRLMKQSNERVPIPQYSFIQHKRLPEPTYANPANIILFQGLMAFHDPRIRDLMTYKVFITCDDDIRLCRRIKRDTKQRGRTIESVLLQYNKFVKDSFKNYIQPTMVFADIIIPGFRNNRVSVDFIVQHIKYIARRINFRQTASRTKVYIFGENQLYDFEYRQSPQVAMTLGNESFLVFPTSQQHKKQLQFFMNRLISQTFSQQYYEQIYICQFLKIQKSLLNQLIDLKQFKKKDIQVFSAHHISQIQKYHLLQKKIKVIFFPMAYTSNAEKLIHMIKKQKQKHPNNVFVILTIFSDMNFPRIIYKIGLSNLILINLFIIANEKRFKQTMLNNTIITQNKDWLFNDEVMSNQGAQIISNDLKITLISELSIQKSKYNEAIKNQPKKLIKRNINEQNQIVKPFYQKQVYSQEHENLCGYHTLANIIMLSKKQEITSKERFIKYYNILSKLTSNNDYKELQRNQIQSLLKYNQFMGLHISIFYYSSGYLQNTVQQLNQIQKQILLHKRNKIQTVYLIMGIYDHFFLLQFSDQQNQKGNKIINLYDSSNISLTDIINATDLQYKKDHVNVDEKDLEQYHKHTKNIRQALEVIRLSATQNKKLTQILIEKRIQIICVPFLQLKDESEIEYFFRNQYPIPVIINDLLKPLKRIGQSILSEKYRNILNQWRLQPAIKWAILASISE